MTARLLAACIGTIAGFLFGFAIGRSRSITEARANRAALRSLSKHYGWRIPFWETNRSIRNRLRALTAQERAEEPTIGFDDKGHLYSQPSPAAIRREAAKRLGLPLDQVRVTFPTETHVRVAVFWLRPEQREQLHTELAEILPMGLLLEVADFDEAP